MSIRIIGGDWRGRTIPSPKSSSTRPSTDMWRSAVFSALEHHVDIQGAAVFDLFAGTGALGLECLSRGAKHATFVEKDSDACRQITSTLSHLQAQERSNVLRADVFDFLRSPTNARSLQGAALVFLDPPYAQRLCNRVLHALSRSLSPDALVVVEHGANEALLEDDSYAREWLRERSVTVVEFLRYKG